MSLKAGSGRVESSREKWNSHLWERIRVRVRSTDRDVGAVDMVEARINDRVAEVFAPHDAIRMAELDRLARLGPDPDENTDEDPNSLRFPCEACGEREGFLPRPRFGGVPQKGSARICHECRRDGFRSTRCDCGRPLHHRDYASNSKRGRVMGTKCGECRKRIRAEFGYSSGVRAP